MFLLLWYKTRNTSFMLLSAFFAGFVSFTKLEGTIFQLIYLVLFILISVSLNKNTIKHHLKLFFKFAVPSLGICLGYHFVKLANNIVYDGTGESAKVKFEFVTDRFLLIPNIISNFLNDMLYSGNWAAVWIVLFISLIHLEKKQNRTIIFCLLACLFMFIGLYIATALFTVNFTWIAGEQMDTTLSRLILHFFPLATLLIPLLNHSDEC